MKVPRIFTFGDELGRAAMTATSVTIMMLCENRHSTNDMHGVHNLYDKNYFPNWWRQKDVNFHRWQAESNSFTTSFIRVIFFEGWPTEGLF